MRLPVRLAHTWFPFFTLTTCVVSSDHIGSTLECVTGGSAENLTKQSTTLVTQDPMGGPAECPNQGQIQGCVDIFVSRSAALLTNVVLDVREQQTLDGDTGDRTRYLHDAYSQLHRVTMSTIYVASRILPQRMLP